MEDFSASGQAYNRFTWLDGIESRVIYYLLSYNNKNVEEKKQVDILRKLISYPDSDALYKEVPDSRRINQLISNDNTNQSSKRVFRSPYLQDSLDEGGSIIKVYVDSIIPENNMQAVVNVGIEVISDVADINISIPLDKDEADEGAGYLGDGNIYIDDYDGISEEGTTDKILKVSYESRVTAMAKAVLYLLNGASVQGVGKMNFSRKMSIFQQAQYGIWNHRKYEGMKIVMGVRMSGVS